MITMKKFLSYAMATVMVLALPTMAFAKKDKNSSGFAGKVTAVDTTANTITVGQKKKGEDKTFKAADAKITVDGTSAKLADITVGMHAKVTVGTSPDVASAIDASAGKKGEKGGKKKKK